MTHRDAVLLWRVLNTPEVRDSCPSPRFAYAVARNKQRLESVMKALETARTASQEVRDYVGERQKLVLSCAVQREGKPVFSSDGENVLLDPVRKEEYELAAAKLDAQYPTAKRQIAELDAALEALMAEPVDFAPYQVSLDDVPAGLPARVYDALLWMVRPPETAV
jgi:hypothetical protein